MKKFSLVLILMGLLVASCEGPSGPPGPQGPSGASGTNILGQTYEEKVNFTSTNDYQFNFNFPEQIFPSDVVLVYLMHKEVNNEPYWRPLPQHYPFPDDIDGTLTYNYDFTKFRVNIFLESNFNPVLLSDDWTIDQWIRIVVVPSDVANKLSKNPSYEEVTQALKIKEVDFKKIK